MPNPDGLNLKRGSLLPSFRHRLSLLLCSYSPFRNPGSKHCLPATLHQGPWEGPSLHCLLSSVGERRDTITDSTLLPEAGVSRTHRVGHPVTSFSTKRESL